MRISFTILLMTIFLAISLLGVTISFFQEDLSQALYDLATQEGITIITDSSVGGFITLDLADVTISDALDLMLLPGGYSWKEIEPKVYFVGMAVPTSNSFIYLVSSTPYHLKYITANTAVDFLPDVMKKFIFKSTNSPYILLIGAPDDMKAKILSIIKMVDIPIKEVVVRLQIIEVDESVLKKWGMSMEYSFPSSSSTSVMLNVLNGVTSLGYKGNQISILSDIKSEETNGKVKTLANPRVRITSGNTGSVDVSTTRKYPYTNQYGRKDYKDVKVGVNIKVTPTILASNDVTIALSESLSKVMETTNPIPDTMTHSLSTTFDIKIGDTVAVGGMSFDTYEKTLSKTPILGDIPVIGYLFTQENMKRVRKELIVIITCEKVGE
ncbi:MAG: type II and III secretion system protein [Thermotogae bacterium]|nr:type II and III secretion system protein [Thermotogota bacterium]